MPRRTNGSVYRTATGYGIRWPEDGRRPHHAGFKTKTEARRWFAANVAPRLDRGSPSPDITFDGFCDLFLERHGATVSERTRATGPAIIAPSAATPRACSPERDPGRRQPGKSSLLLCRLGEGYGRLS